MRNLIQLLTGLLLILLGLFLPNLAGCLSRGPSGERVYDLQEFDYVVLDMRDAAQDTALTYRVEDPAFAERLGGIVVKLDSLHTQLQNHISAGGPTTDLIGAIDAAFLVVEPVVLDIAGLNPRSQIIVRALLIPLKATLRSWRRQIAPAEPMPASTAARRPPEAAAPALAG